MKLTVSAEKNLKKGNKQNTFFDYLKLQAHVTVLNSTSQVIFRTIVS